ncbi:MAG: asparagine synthase (glutamine-hydrolyzing) [Flavobacteriales bacterium]|nr:asparagine synthase (glutamine-hydrolyzing) [Flavobacteriales bacterium]
MCGIAGYIGKNRPGESQIRGALSKMANRGPDAANYELVEQGNLQMAFLHSRLSIIDLDERSNQPFLRRGCTLVFNGEIYNYVELRRQLLADGMQLTTDGDTEVLMEYYLKYGEDCVKYFEGMWSFVLHDSTRNAVFLSRDRFAEKPLYYFQSSHGFYFGSEVKFIEALMGTRLPVNENHLMRYMINGHKSLYKTKEHFFTGLRELDFAERAWISEDLTITKSKFWTPRFAPKHAITEGEAIEGIRHHLTESLKLRLRSDVPLSFCLSGGVDSASLVSIASKVFNAQVNTFSIIDSDHRYDEYENIKATIEDTGCQSTRIVLEPGDHHISRLEKLVDYHDAPIATISYFIHSMLSESIASKGYKISISGTAADEMFTGYYDHFIMHLYEIKGDPEFGAYKNDWENEVLKFVRHPDFKKWDYFFDNPAKRDHVYLNNHEFRGMLKKDFNEPFTETNYSDSLLRNRMMNEMFHEVVRVILHEDDLNSMFYSIENRSPFLDTSLFEFAYSIPTKHLIRNGYNKYLLRESMKGILNDKVRLSREKKGFNASINSIFDFKNPAHRDYFLSDSPIFDWFEKDKIAALISQKQFSNSFKKFLFDFVCTKIFLEQRNQ